MRKKALFGLIMVGALVSGLANAQMPAPADGAQQHPHMSAEDRAAFLDARLAALKAGLHLTPEQEKLWPPVEAVLRENAQKMREAQQKRHQQPPSKDLIEELRFMADLNGQRAAGLKALADTAEPLYKTLTPEQKERLPKLMHGLENSFGMRHHGMMHGPKGPGEGHEPNGGQ